MARPTTYSLEVAERICEAFAQSDKGLRKTLEVDPTLPEYGCVMEWRSRHAQFSEMFARAKQQQLENMAEDIVDLSDREDLEPNDKRIRVETRKWLLSKLMSRTYGDKLDVTSDGKALAVPSHQIDARVQSIIMQARERKREGIGLIEGLDEEAQRLLE